MAKSVIKDNYIPIVKVSDLDIEFDLLGFKWINFRKWLLKS